ncbi:MAG: NAD(P)/FAD-dependent oxidoreductase, partial [Bradyrhizobium sp.]
MNVQVSKTNKRVVIVGAGHAGGHAAMAARAAAPSANIVLVGSEHYPPYERPPLSKAVLMGTSSAETTFLKPAAHYREKAIDLRLGASVVEIDRAAGRVLIDGRDFEPYDALILTTGARPRSLPVPGGQARAVFYLRDINDAVAIRAALAPATRVAVIGAGLIGLEVAASAHMLGCKVVVLEMASGPMQRVLASEVARFFTELHVAHGVELQFDTK